MKQIERILVPVGSFSNEQPAIERAMSLARRCAAKLTLLNVDQALPDFYRSLLGEHKAQLTRRRKQQLEEISDRIAAIGVSVQCKWAAGRPFVEIIREAMRGGYDLVVCGTAETKLGPPSSGFGPVEMRLLRQCPCPVWIVTPAENRTVNRRIVAAVEPERRDANRLSVGRRILELASSVARLENMELSAVSAWEVPGGREWLAPQLSAAKFEMLTAAVRDEARFAIDELLAIDLPVAPAHLHFAEGDAAEVIADYVGETKPDVLVMGSVSHTGIPGLLIGNTAERVYRRIDCSVLSVKPDGFVSPVNSR